MNQTIWLNAIGSEEYLDAVATQDPVKMRAIMPTIAHEVRHWIDHCASLWGQSDLKASFEAMAAKITGSEVDYWKVIEYIRNASRDRLEAYYSVIERPTPPEGSDGTWNIRFSTGLRFDADGRPAPNKPIIFANFFWQDGNLACRAPLSVASLLEVSAMYFEFATKRFWIDRLPGAAAEVQGKSMQEELHSYLFAPGLVEYSVAVHTLLRKVHTDDWLRAFEAASAIAWVSLNLVPKMFDHLTIPEEFGYWGERAGNFLLQRDRGFAYLLLTQAAPEI